MSSAKLDCKHMITRSLIVLSLPGINMSTWDPRGMDQKKTRWPGEERANLLSSDAYDQAQPLEAELNVEREIICKGSVTVAWVEFNTIISYSLEPWTSVSILLQKMRVPGADYTTVIYEVSYCFFRLHLP